MKKSAEKNSKKTFLPLILILTGILLGVCIKLFVFDFIITSGQSMNPTLHDKEVLFISKSAYGIPNPNYKNFLIQWKAPAKNDIVLFLHDNKIVVKRCVLTEGDSIEILTDKHYIYKLRVENKNIPLTSAQMEWLKDYSTVPRGFVFVVGDNAEYSIDSRDYGFVAVKNITGKVIGKNK